MIFLEIINNTLPSLLNVIFKIFPKIKMFLIKRTFKILENCYDEYFYLSPYIKMSEKTETITHLLWKQDFFSFCFPRFKYILDVNISANDEKFIPFNYQDNSSWINSISSTELLLFRKSAKKLLKKIKEIGKVIKKYDLLKFYKNASNTKRTYSEFFIKNNFNEFNLNTIIFFQKNIKNSDIEMEPNIISNSINFNTSLKENKKENKKKKREYIKSISNNLFSILFQYTEKNKNTINVLLNFSIDEEIKIDLEVKSWYYVNKLDVRNDNYSVDLTDKLIDSIKKAFKIK